MGTGCQAPVLQKEAVPSPLKALSITFVASDDLPVFVAQDEFLREQFQERESLAAGLRFRQIVQEESPGAKQFNDAAARDFRPCGHCHLLTFPVHSSRG